MALAEGLRSEARRLIEAANTASDAEAKRNMARRCVELSQRAELIERAETNPKLVERYIRFCQYRLAGGLSDAAYREILDHLLSDLMELRSTLARREPAAFHRPEHTKRLAPRRVPRLAKIGPV